MTILKFSERLGLHFIIYSTPSILEAIDLNNAGEMNGMSINDTSLTYHSTSGNLTNMRMVKLLQIVLAIIWYPCTWYLYFLCKNCACYVLNFLVYMYHYHKAGVSILHHLIISVAEQAQQQ